MTAPYTEESLPVPPGAGSGDRPHQCCSLHASDASEVNSRSHARFPLTPTLSLGERESHFPSFDEPEPLQSPDACARALPLPKGEGWGGGGVRFRPGPCTVEDPCKVQPPMLILTHNSPG